MSRIQTNSDFGNIDNLEGFIRWVSTFCKEAVSIINGNLEWDKNFKSTSVQVVFSQANAEFTVKHNLGRVPKGFLVGNMDSAAVVYKTSRAWDKNAIFLQANSPCTALIIVF